MRGLPLFIQDASPIDKLKYILIAIIGFILLFILLSLIFSTEIAARCIPAKTCNDENVACQQRCSTILIGGSLPGYESQANYARCIEECKVLRDACFDERTGAKCRLLFK